MERLCVLIYETAEDRKKILHDVLVAYAISENVEVVIKWLKRPLREDAVSDACVEARIAFVNAADPEVAAWIGACLFRENLDCGLVYYADEVPSDVIHTVDYFAGLFPSRPVRYLYRPSPQGFAETIREFSDAESRKKRFDWENKGMKYRVPYGSIRYFRSDRNYVYLRQTNGMEYAFLGKLANVEKQLPGGLFVRVHQSYLVSRDEIVAIDKQKKTVHLRGGEELFISKARYKETMEVCAVTP